MCPVPRRNRHDPERPIMTVENPALDPAFAVPADEARLDRASVALRAKGFIVHVVDTAADARKLLADLLPRDQEIFTASSETLRLSGIAADIDEADGFLSLRRKAGPPSADVWEQIRFGATPDV